MGVALDHLQAGAEFARHLHNTEKFMRLRRFEPQLRQRVRDSLLGPQLAETGIFNTAFLRELVEQHESGRRDYSAPIWTVLMFEAFLRKEMEGALA